jgi:hypothetical protein
VVKEIIILPAAGCRRSQKILAYLEKERVPFTRFDLASAEGQALAQDHDVRASPGIIVDGSSVNPFDVVEQPSCRIKTMAARELFGLAEQR